MEFASFRTLYIVS